MRIGLELLMDADAGWDWIRAGRGRGGYCKYYTVLLQAGYYGSTIYGYMNMIELVGLIETFNSIIAAFLEYSWNGYLVPGALGGMDNT